MQFNNSPRTMYDQNMNSMSAERRMYNNTMYNNNNTYQQSNYPKQNFGQLNFPNSMPNNQSNFVRTMSDQGYYNKSEPEEEYFDPRDLPPRMPPSQDMSNYGNNDGGYSAEDQFIKDIKEYNERVEAGLERRIERIDTINPHNNMRTTRTVEIEPPEKTNEEEEFVLERILEKRIIKGGNVEYLQKWKASAKTDKVYQGLNENNSWEITWTDNIDGNYYKLANEFEKKSSIDKVTVIRSSSSRKRKNPDDDKFTEEEFKLEAIVETQTVKCDKSADFRKPLLKQIRRLWVFEEPSSIDVVVPPVRTGGKGRPPNPLPAMVTRSVPAPTQPSAETEDIDLKDIDTFRSNLPALFNPNAPISGRAIMELMESRFGKPKTNAKTE